MKNLLIAGLVLLFTCTMVHAQEPTDGRIKPMPTVTAVKVGQEFDVAIRINSTLPVYASSFILDWGDTFPVDVVSVTVGDYLGTPVLFTYIVNEALSDVHISVSQQGPASGVTGLGTLAVVRFRANNAANMDVRQVNFGVFDIDVRNPATQRMNFSGITGFVLIAEAFVWPGDLNNDGTADEADVLSIGQHFNKTGSTRPNATYTWQAEPSANWADTNATYADANADGRIKINDMPPIGFNYGKTHASAMPATAFKVSEAQSGNRLYASARVVGDTAEVYMMAEAEDLFGIAFKAMYDTGELEFVSAQNGDYLPGAIFFNHVIPNDGLLALASTRVNGETGITTNASVVVARFLMKGNSLNLRFEDVTAMNTAGDHIGFEVQDLSQVTGVGEDNKPVVFTLMQNYPNPFNPSTRIRFTIEQSSAVTLTVRNVLGQVVTTLVNGETSPGEHFVTFDASGLAGGMYYYTIQAGLFRETRKMMLMK